MNFLYYWYSNEKLARYKITRPIVNADDEVFNCQKVAWNEMAWVTIQYSGRSANAIQQDVSTTLGSTIAAFGKSTSCIQSADFSILYLVLS